MLISAMPCETTNPPVQLLLRQLFFRARKLHKMFHKCVKVQFNGLCFDMIQFSGLWFDRILQIVFLLVIMEAWFDRILQIVFLLVIWRPGLTGYCKLSSP